MEIKQGHRTGRN